MPGGYIFFTAVVCIGLFSLRYFLSKLVPTHSPVSAAAAGRKSVSSSWSL